MATKDSVDVRKSFNWLRREARGPTYISFSAFSDRPACSFDFGDNGCAASCNFGGELLQMRARDDEKGLVFAHGDFERTYYSSLARAQRKHGRQATFGLGIARNQKPFQNDKNKSKSERGSNLKLGEMIERGCFNYRWPFNEYVLLLNEADDSSPKETGTCTRVSFVENGILYQVIRLEKGCRLEADICHYTPWMGQVALSVGGLVHFGELDTDVPYAKFDQSTLKSGLLSLEGSSNRLDIRVRQLIGDKYKDLPLYLPNNNEDYGGQNKVGSYRAYVDLPGTNNGNFQDRQVTFIAEFKLQGTKGNDEWPETPNSETIYDYLGIDCRSETATGVMWETIFLQREEKSSYFSELSEVNLVGRCVEKILTVDLVPATIHKKDHVFNNEQPLSLISNMFVQPSIDLESLFWKVRFLVKAYRFLSSFKDIHSQQVSDESSDNAIDQKPSNTTKVESHDHTIKSAWAPVATIEEIVEFQMKRIQASPGTHTSPQSLASKTFQSNYYYSYNFKWNWIDDKTKSWSADDCLLSNCLPPDNLLPEHKERERVALLKWYHYASILNLTKRQMHLPQSWDKEGLNHKVNQLERDARRAAAAKLSSRHPYSAEDEIIDRLGNRAGSVSSITSRRILERDYTHYLNPGNLLGGEKGPTSGPWEIHALCYHSRLLVENYQYKKNDEKTREQKVEDVENMSHSMLGEDEYNFISIRGDERFGLYSFEHLPEGFLYS
ncbi:hypothetical protein F4806DRAFT_489206 [Annulohypoxylon nitens]|nr:hypothetical protein F4806DRAFT_489206 [Annulohypoxylon nitens]